MSLKNSILFFIFLLLTSCKENNTNVQLHKEDVNLVNIQEEINGGLFLPDGFEALVVADSVGPSRHMAVNNNGDIYIKLREDKGNMGNMALRDTTNDGRADIFQRFGDYPNDGRFATEMRLHKGYLYFSSEHVVYRQKLTPGKLIPAGRPEVLLVDNYPMRWHNSKVLAFDNQGGMYVTFSAPTNACEDWNTAPSASNVNVKGENPCSQLDILGGVWKFKEDKLNQTQADGKRYATGLRSIVALSWNEEDNSLYGMNHGRDYLYNHAPQYYSSWQNAVLPAEEFMNIKDGEDYGWPYTYYDQFKHKRMLAPEYGGDGRIESKEYSNPIMGLPAHWAPNDLIFYKGSQFPSRYKKGAFVAFHGSTNRAPYPQAGYIVAFIPFKNGKPTDKWEVFADGFAGVDLIKLVDDAKYRPMGLAEGPDGSLYISDSKKGKIWRIKYKSNATGFGKEQLAEMEKRKSRSYIKTPHRRKDIVILK